LSRPRIASARRAAVAAVNSGPGIG
jgi:hypothetical protein